MKELWYGHWIPQEFVIILMMLVGFLIMFQQRKWALSLFLLGMGAIFTPHLITALKPSLIEVATQAPTIIEQTTRTWSLASMIIAGVVLLAMLLRFILGKEVWNEVIGILIADFFRWIIKAPFVFLGWIFKSFFKIFGSDRR